MSGDGGWEITEQSKEYGPWVKITLSDGEMGIHVKDDDPMGLALDNDKTTKDVAPTRMNADKIGFALAQLYEAVDLCRTREPQRASLPPPRPGAYANTSD